MTLPVYIVDAFTEAAFSGNPAAVVPLGQWLPDGVMQSIAAQHNLAETAFTVPMEDGFGLRWFTPRVEVDLCGHATLAAAHVHATELGHAEGVLHFHTRSGRLEVHRKDVDKYMLDFPSDPPLSLPEPPVGLVEALGVTPLEVLRGRFDYLVVLANEAELRALSPSMAKLSRIEARGFTVTAWTGPEGFASRFFAPACGVDEDPVTGSAHCTLTPYWAGETGMTRFKARQLSARGGNLDCILSGDRVLLTGAARLYLRGEIHI
jgi:PhzF family phenazine biosynthesis protein